ncbi:MAG: aldehyde dehydrogenase family protein [Thermoleophilaceae bacterium]
MSVALNKPAESFLGSLKPRLLIGGRWVEPPTNVSPSSTHLPLPRSSTYPRRARRTSTPRFAQPAARSRRAKWAELTPPERRRLLLRLADAIDLRAGELAELEALDNGKSVVTARDVDVAKAVEWFEYFAGWASKLEGATIPVSAERLLVYTLREPVGRSARSCPGTSRSCSRRGSWLPHRSYTR